MFLSGSEQKYHPEIFTFRIQLQEDKMPRPLRKCIPDKTYHCYSRCIECRNMLSPEFVKEIAINVLHQAMKKYLFHLVTIEFVENHFHIIIKTINGGETISRIMQYIKARITEKYNKLMNRTGTFWNERFKSKQNNNSQPFTFLRITFRNCFQYFLILYH